MSTGWKFPDRFRDSLSPATVVDVGVSKGTQPLYDAFPGAYFLLVEPLSENVRHMKRILRHVKGEYVLSAAGSTTGTAQLNVEPERNGMSSILKRTDMTATGAQLERREIPVDTLDNLVGSRPVDKPYGLKIDTEGFELEVLRGAKAFLADCQFVLTEASTTRRFEGSYSSGELIDELRGHGFEIVEILGSTKTYVDLLFIRS